MLRGKQRFLELKCIKSLKVVTEVSIDCAKCLRCITCDMYGGYTNLRRTLVDINNKLAKRTCYGYNFQIKRSCHFANYLFKSLHLYLQPTTDYSVLVKKLVHIGTLTSQVPKK